ncbi:MAG: rRNA adenine N-6-methyltransferase family protein [Pseudobdellovibrionaceae bacterium]
MSEDLVIDFKICQHAQTCSGCFYFRDDYQVSLDIQKSEKIESFCKSTRDLAWAGKNLNFTYLNPNPLQYRNHLDFTLDHGKLGLYHHPTQQITDIENCLILDSNLLKYYRQVKPLLPKDKKGSLKMRYDGCEKFGVWFDFSNLDIKELLEKKDLLQSILKTNFVEMGQRGKSVIEKAGELKLSLPVYRLWFSTLYKDKTIPLFSLIKSFTQSGLKNNYSMIQEIQSFYRAKFGSRQLSKALEMGCGIGNLTIPFLEFFRSITCFEFDQTALDGLALTKKRLESENLIAEDQIQLVHGDFYQQHALQNLDLDSHQALILNPARAGVGNYLKQLSTHQSIEVIFLMSCYLEGFTKDAELIQEAGFRCEKVILFDQFSFSKHFEILSFWSR